MLPKFVLVTLLLFALSFKAYGAILIAILFAGFTVIVINSRKYPKVNGFFDKVF